MRTPEQILKECIRELKSIGIPMQQLSIGTAVFARLRGKLCRYVFDWDRSCHVLELSDFFQKNKIDEREVKALFCRELLCTAGSHRWKLEDRLHYQKLAEEAFGYEMMRRRTRYELLHPQKETLGTLRCRCGSRWDVKEPRVWREILNGKQQTCHLCDRKLKVVGAHKPTREKKLPELVAMCTQALRGIGAKPGELDQVSFEKVRGQLGEVYRSGERFRIELSDVLASESVNESDLRDALCRELLYTCEGCWDDGARRAAYAKQLDEAHQWNVLHWKTKCDVQRPKKAPLKRMVCPICGGVWDVKEAKALRRIEESDYVYCKVCRASVMVEEGHEDEVLERDLDKLTIECREKLEAIGIPLGEISSVRYHVLSNFLGVCYTPQKKASYIEIDPAFRLKRCPEEELKITLIHEMLHTCKDCQNHGPVWRGYARHVEEAYGYEILCNGSWWDILHREKPECVRLICPKCGGYLRVRNEKWVELLRAGAAHNCCAWCGTKMQVTERGDATEK